MNKKIIYSLSVFLWIVFFIALLSNTGFSNKATITGASVFSIKNVAPIPFSFLIITLLVITNVITLYFIIKKKE